MSTLLSKNLVERAAWTGLEAIVALAIVELGQVPMWWAAPLALFLSAFKTAIVDRRTKEGV